MKDRLLRLRDVSGQTGISRAWIYKLIRDGQFPKPAARLSTKAVRWSENDVQQWIAQQTGKTA